MLRGWLRMQGETGESGPDLGPRAVDLDEVKALARARYPGGVAVDFDQSWAAREGATQRLIVDPAVPAIFGGCFTFQGVEARVGILARTTGGWLVIEQKSVNRIHEKHELDVAASAWAVKGAGLPVVGLRLLHLDREYSRGSSGVDPRQLFIEVEVEPVDFSETAEILGLELASMPVVETGEQCTRPRRCEFHGRCNPVPGPFSIHHLPKSGRVHLDLVARGVDDIRKVPSDVRLKPMQQHAVWAMVNGREYVSHALGPALTNVQFPLRFLDIECVAPPVPRWPGARPFEQFPTQWSIHTLQADGSLAHEAFLHRADSDPCSAFARSIIASAGSDGNVIVYSEGEIQVLRRLAETVPECWGDIDGILDRTRELLRVLREHYYHPSLDGSFSLKSVLPAVCPELGYEGLSIAEGASAGKAWLDLVDDRKPAAEREQVANALLAYCERDTLGMVRLRERLLAKAAAT